MINPLIGVEHLKHLLASRTPPVVGDVRWTLAAGADHQGYRRGHLPGAAFVAMEQDLCREPGDCGRHPLPDAATFSKAMRRLGVNADSLVVFYDAGPGIAASRAWWLLRHFGHDDVRVLNGGLGAWTAAGGALTSVLATSAPGNFTLGPSRALTVEVTDVLPAAARGVLLDARDVERYRGRVDSVDKVAGHIPGAVSAPTTDNLGEDGMFLPAAELRARFDALGVSDGDEVTVYCGSGITAAHEILALHAAGYAAALYPGSWSHWIVDETRPIASNGDTPTNPPGTDRR